MLLYSEFTQKSLLGLLLLFDVLIVVEQNILQTLQEIQLKNAKPN